MAVMESDSFAGDIMSNVINLFAQGNLKPAYPLHIYPLENIEQAVRFLQSGKSDGKLVLKINKEASVPVSLSRYYPRIFTTLESFLTMK
jgi:NADPH-dependent curcumin reductase CurA